MSEWFHGGDVITDGTVTGTIRISTCSIRLEPGGISRCRRSASIAG
jgi:hypothetical protein